MTIEELMTCTEVTYAQLNSEIDERDMILLAPHFRDVETLSEQLGLTPANLQNAKNASLQFDVQTGVKKALSLWRRADPSAATYRKLVEIVLRMGGNGVPIATEVCNVAASIEGKSATLTIVSTVMQWCS